MKTHNYSGHGSDNGHLAHIEMLSYYGISDTWDSDFPERKRSFVSQKKNEQLLWIIR